MPSVTVSDLRAAGRDAARIRATHALSLLDPDGTPAPDLGLPPDRHLVLRFLDIDDDGFGARRGPDLPIVEAILGFASGIPESGAVLVHCHAGVSRSPAAALLMLSEWGRRWICRGTPDFRTNGCFGSQATSRDGPWSRQAKP